ncbi:MAG: hypothetical protein JWN67_426 [Actinomycetia bacterium]|nr:hypothetical protein [Actinomycetes bacterium]
MSDVSRSLTLRYLGQDVSATTTTAKVESSLFGLSSANEKALSSFKATTAQLAGQFGPAGAAAEKTLNGVAASSLATGGALSTGVAAGAAVVGAGLLKMSMDGVKSYVALAGEVRNYQRVSGASAEDSSRMVAASKAVGVESQSTANAVFRLSQNVEKHSDVLKADGIEVVRNAKGHTDLQQTLLAVADAYQKTEDPAKRNKLVMDAFGRSGAAILPILASGKDRLEEFWAAAEKHHQILSDEDLTKARDYNQATRELGQAWSGLERKLGAKVVPALTGVAKGLTDVIDTGDRSANAVSHLLGPVGGLGGVAEKATKAGLGPLNSALDLARGHFKDAAVDAVPLANSIDFLSRKHKDNADATDTMTAASEAVSQAMGGEAAAAGEAASAQAAHAKAVDRVAQAQMGLIGGQVAVDKAYQDVIDANDVLAGKSLKAASAGSTAADVSERVATASRSLRDAVQSAADAVDRIADAEEAEVEAGRRVEASKRSLTRTEQQLTKAHQDAAQAQLDQRDTAQELTKAEEKLQRALAGQSSDLTDGAAAQEAVNAAQLDAKQAGLDVADAQDDLTRRTNELSSARADSKTTGFELAAAERAVAEASIGVQRAQARQQQSTRDAAKAVQNLNAVLADNPNVSRDVKDAAKALEDAQRANAGAIDAVHDAQDRIIDSTQAVTDAHHDVETSVRGVEQAHKDLAKAEREAKDRADDIVAKRQAVVDAHKATGGAASGSAAAHKTLAERISDAETAYDNYAQAVVDKAAREAEAAGRTMDAKAKADLYIATLERLRDLLDPNNPLRHNLQGLIDVFNFLAGLANGNVISPGLGNSPGFEHRAAGGPVKAGVGYIVNEQGPGTEMFVPGVDGTILTASETRARATSQAVTYAATPVHFHVHGNVYGLDDLDGRMRRLIRDWEADVERRRRAR